MVHGSNTAVCEWAISGGTGEKVQLEVRPLLSFVDYHHLQHEDAGFNADLTIEADPVKLIQIFLNILGNAIKFTPRGGRIEVALSCCDEHGVPSLQVEISDTGVGVPAEHLQDIFEGFRQVDGSHTREHGGVGLGLALTKQLVELHHGRIWAESTLGSGSKFTFIIPRQQPAPKKDLAANQR